MIPLSEISRFASTIQVAAETIEKDYVISWILLCLARSDLKDNFLFYGGTAIKRIYFEDHRFSEDIDLISTNRYNLDYIQQQFSCLKYAEENANLVLEINLNKIMATKDRIQLYVNYFGYEEIIGSPKEIRIDLVMDMEINGQFIQKEILETYSDISPHNRALSVMTINTILANKLGLLTEITRNEPRDLYDIWFLLMKINEFDFNFEEVRKIFREKYSFYPTLSGLLPHIKNVSFKKNWEFRLKKQIAELPNIDQVIDEIIAKLSILFTL